MAAGEVRDPGRNLPRAIVIGTLVVLAIFLGDTAQGFLAFALTASALSAMTGSMLTGARVPFAMARDGLAPARLAHVSSGARVPVIAVLIQGGWASLLATSGRFDELTNYVVFTSWMFYALNAGGVILLRRKQPDLARPYRVPLYPIVPLTFLVLSTLLLVNTVHSATEQTLRGLGFMALAVPVYLVLHRRRA